MDYHKSGALKDDAFMKSRPVSGGNLKETSWKQPYDNVMRRVKMAQALRNEGYFDDDQQPATTQSIAPKVMVQVRK